MKKTLSIVSILFCLWTRSFAAANELLIFEDILYWHASQQTSSPWAYVQTFQSADPAEPRPSNTYTEPNVYFHWSPGLKLGMQYKKADDFDGKLYWTHFSSVSQEHINAAANELILPEFFSGFTSLNLFNAAQLNWKIILNSLDAELGHRFIPVEDLSIRPFFGIKATQIKQAIGSSWQTNLVNDSINAATEQLNNNFSGVGPSFGIETQWGLYKNLNIRSDFATALLWGSWNIDDVFHRPSSFLGLIPESTIYSKNQHSMLGSFMASGFMGLEWRLPTKTQVTIKAGYEMQFFSNQLRLPVFQALPIHGDLTLQGATCGILINL